ncbi:MAG: hypothetical protein KA715_12465 [Xanthomonadaceae bacterium]|nr:hypothetical protein [Xanthomonadaceae bacterium]
MKNFIIAWVATFSILIEGVHAQGLFFETETAVAKEQNSLWESSRDQEGIRYIQNSASSALLTKHERMRDLISQDSRIVGCMHTLLATTGNKHKLYL